MLRPRARRLPLEAEASGGFSLAQLVNLSIASEEAQEQIDGRTIEGQSRTCKSTTPKRKGPLKPISDNDEAKADEAQPRRCGASSSDEGCERAGHRAQSAISFGLHPVVLDLFT